MDRETETVINRLMSDLKAAQDLSDYLAANNKKLREALRYYAKTDYFPTSDGPWGVDSDDFGNVARTALKEGE